MNYHHLHDALGILQLLGVKLTMEFDGEIMIEYPEQVIRYDFARVLGPYEQAMRENYKRRVEIQLRQYVGGPLNGRQIFHTCSTQRQFVCVNTGRKKWAVYKMPDRYAREGSGKERHRAFFVGWATSEKKGKLGIVSDDRQAKGDSKCDS